MVSIDSFKMRFGMASPPGAFLDGACCIAFLISFIVINTIAWADGYAAVSAISVRSAPIGGGKNVRRSRSALGPGSLISGSSGPSFNGGKQACCVCGFLAYLVFFHII